MNIACSTENTHKFDILYGLLCCNVGILWSWKCSVWNYFGIPNQWWQSYGFLSSSSQKFEHGNNASWLFKTCCDPNSPNHHIWILNSAKGKSILRQCCINQANNFWKLTTHFSKSVNYSDCNWMDFQIKLQLFRNHWAKKGINCSDVFEWCRFENRSKGINCWSCMLHCGLNTERVWLQIYAQAHSMHFRSTMDNSIDKWMRTFLLCILCNRHFWWNIKYLNQNIVWHSKFSNWIVRQRDKCMS